MKKYIIVSVLFLFLIKLAVSQNLVPNPGFESFYTCPQTFNKNAKEVCPNWMGVKGTPDVFNKCSTTDMGYINIVGISNPIEGKGYCGIIAWDKKNSNELLQVKLIDSLQKDKIYQISYYYKLSTYSMFCVDRLGFILSDSSSIDYKSDYVYEQVNDNFYFNHLQWECIRNEFKAKGGENYLTIGNISSNQQTKVYHRTETSAQEPMVELASYYYIDAVTVIEKDISNQNPVSESDTVNKLTTNVLSKTSKNYILNNVLFKNNSFTLVENDLVELKTIIKLLKSTSSLLLQITGHTDDVGTETYNLELSLKRAESIKNYLVKKGISETRIKTKGEGNLKPLSKVKNEDARKINRRVEISFE